MSTTFYWIYLGTSTTQIDPTEGNSDAEGASAFVGKTYGSSTDPLMNHVTWATAQDRGGQANILDMNNDTASGGSADQFSTNIGAGTQTFTFDGGAIYDATITYADGTTATVTAVVVQDANGHLFLAPETTYNPDTTAYEARPLRSITLNAINGNVIAYQGMTADRYVTGYDDGFVDGTANADLIDASYVEPVAGGSDKVDNNDAGPGAVGNDDIIRAMGGNDSVHAAMGNDTVYGGDGNDLVYGGEGSDSLLGEAGDDTVYGDAGRDILNGGLGNDQLHGGDNSDLVYGGDGNDSLSGDAGNDTLHGEAGNDTLDGGTGDDSLFGGLGDDSLLGGDGNDTLYFGQGSDTVYGGDGNDLIDDTSGTVESGDNVLDAGAGDDTVWAGDGNDKVLGGAGNDILAGEGGADGIDAGADNDTVFGGDGNDTVWGGTGDDLLLGDSGDDALYGGAGNDSFLGGDGNDWLLGDAGNDTLTGGAGHDRFDMNPGDGRDQIDDFEMTLENGQTIDRIDVSDLRNPDGSRVQSYDVAIADDGQGNTLLTFPGGEQVVLVGVSPQLVAEPGMLSKMGVPCFAGGTLIATPDGPRRVEDLRPGDLLTTAEGPRPLVWHGTRWLDRASLAERPDLRPIRLRAGHFGLARDLILSPQHAVRLGDSLIRARHLAEWARGAHVAHGIRSLRYHHLLLPDHALLQAEGAWVESFYPGVEALRSMAGAERLTVALKIMGLRPAMRGRIGSADLARFYGPRCLPLLSGGQARLFLWALRNRSDQNHGSLAA